MTTSLDTDNIDEWQTSKNTLRERFSFLFNNERLADVYFVVGRDDQQQRIPAHKIVLSVASSLFERMFFGALATKSDEIQLPDIEPPAFLAFLKFIYSDEVELNANTVTATLYVAKKYHLPALERHCVNFFKTNLNSDNAFLLLSQARLFDASQLAASCWHVIDRSTTDAIKADSFKDIDLDTLVAVLERDTLQINELKLFEAVLHWSTVECTRKDLAITPENQRLVLGRAFLLIRFPLMSINEFGVGPVESGLVTDHEVRQLLYFTANPKLSVGFSDVPRRPWTMADKQQLVCRFGYGKPEVKIANFYVDYLRFSVDRRISVMGFGIFGSATPAKYDVYVKLSNSNTRNVCGSNQIAINCDGSDKAYQVMFEESIKINPNTEYMAYVKCEQNGVFKYYCEYDEIKQTTIDGSDGVPVTIKFSKYPTWPHNLIQEIIFST